MKALLVILSLIVALLLGVSSTPVAVSEVRYLGKAEYPIQRRVRYGFTLRNTQPRPLIDVAVEAEAPFKQNSNQRTISVKASEPFELLEDEIGNQTVRFRVTLPPLGSKVISVDAIVAFSGSPQIERPTTGGPFLCAAPAVEVADPAIQRAAASFDQASRAELAKVIFRWVSNHVHSDRYVADRRGALYALEQGRGDCTESADLFVALARARGISARAVAGFVIEGDAVLGSTQYHNWAEFFVDGAWRLADPNRRVFGQSAQQYLTMRVFGDCTGQGDSEFLRRVIVGNPDVAVRMG